MFLLGGVMFAGPNALVSPSSSVSQILSFHRPVATLTVSHENNTVIHSYEIIDQKLILNNIQ